MKIDLTYQGAFAARSKGNYEAYLSDNKDRMAGRELEVMREGEVVRLTFSDDLIDLKNEADKLFSNDENVRNADPNDIFSFRPRDQWMVFSQYLHDNEVFDSLSNDQMSEMESVLQRITDGLDSLTQSGVDYYGGTKTQLDSYEARLELASSTAALSYFSDKYLSGATKEGFERLTAQYVEHNTKKVDQYLSIEEKFYAARARLPLAHNGLNAESASHLAMTNKLGKTSFSEEELEKVSQAYSEAFEKLKSKNDIPDRLQTVRNQLLEFATKGIPQQDKDYDKAKGFVNERVEDTFRRLAEYWGNLLEV